MTLPPSVDAKIRRGFEDLVEYAEEITLQDSFPYAAPGNFTQLKERFLILLDLLVPYKNNRLREIKEQVVELRSVDVEDFDNAGYIFYKDFDELKNLIKSVKTSYESDLLGNLEEQIEAAVANDYLLQAEQLLESGYHVPSAVLLGVILEDALKRICQRQNPPISIVKSNGAPKTLNPLIDDLKKAGVYNEIQAKQLRVWANIRNDAAHGNPQNFMSDEVQDMFNGVQRFLALYL